jgi:hypothetical protein
MQSGLNGALACFVLNVSRWSMKSAEMTGTRETKSSMQIGTSPTCSLASEEIKTIHTANGIQLVGFDARTRRSTYLSST